MKKYANKERGLKFYSKGKDLYKKSFHIQDGSWAYIRGVRIYAHDSNNEHTEICLSLTKEGAKQIIKGLQKFLKVTIILEKQE